MSEADELELPSGWTLTPVGDLLKFKNGLNKGKAYFGFGTPIVNYMDVFRHTGLRRADVHGQVDVTNAEKQAFSARKGDVLFTRTSETPEEVGISTVLLEDIEDAVFSGFVLRGRPVNDRLTSEFAQYCFDSRFVRGQIVSSATYTTRALTNGRILSNVKLPLPEDPEEQQAIAAALSDADGVVAGLERVIAKKRLIKQGAMQDLLTARRRLPGFSGEWEAKRLGDLVTSVTGGGTPSRTRSDFWNGPIPWMTVKDFATGALNTTIESITAEGLKNSASRLVAAGTLILCTRMAVGKTTIMDVDVAINQDLKALSFKSGVSVSFIKRVFEMLQNQIEDNAGGSTVKGISIGDVRGLEFSLPLFDEQQAIAAVLSDMDAEIQTLESRLTKARAVKEGMMQNLLTGRVRLV